MTAPVAPVVPVSPNDLIAALIRTVFPYVGAYVVAYLAKNGFALDGEQINAAIVTIGGSLYYTIVRFIEQKFPQAGWLLGLAKAPVYPEEVAS